ncbi:protein FAM217B isoform X2 [Rhinatrema bivittatum]|uniref:protein FAM217B isoform X2 n=1 Tax=Rhinatrema bivittatum TaxID=194408 RepID=UPI00112B7A16|nr:protein FAM217B isoform X2 [Rhinatrema bivittatum]
MGPGVHDYPSLLDRAIKKREGYSPGSHRRTVTFERGKGPYSTNRSRLRSAPSKRGDNASNSTRKIFQSSFSHVQRSYAKKERNGVNRSHQQIRIQGSKKEASEKKLSESGSHRKLPPSSRSSSLDDAGRAGDSLLQNSYFNKKAGSEILGNVTEVHCYSSKGPRRSAEQMFLDFESIRIIKEEVDEDSASDLSDSERIPFPPSPFTPPELNLRAEKIDPGCFDHLFDLGYKESEYYYPDFLPPPFNSWDLHHLAVFVNTDGKHAPRPQPAGFLERYVERLLQLEWLQVQTIQNENAKVVRSRPQTANCSNRGVKSPGKIRSWHSQVPNKQPAHLEHLSRFPPGQTSNHLRKDFHGEVEPSPFHACQSHSRVVNASSDTSSPQKSVNSVVKKKAENKKPQRSEMEACKCSPKLQSASAIRSPTFHSPAEPLKGLKTYVYVNPKKNAAANNCYTPTKKTTAERKLKANGVKQTSCKYKQM